MARFVGPVLACAAMLLPASALARPKTDVVVLDNGDRLTCEIKKLQRGKLTIKTDAFGTTSVKWSRVTGIASDYFYQVELQRGDRFLGRVSLGSESGTVQIEDDEGGRVVAVPSIVEIIPVESSFWNRIKGSVDAGFDFSQASTATSWSSSAAIEYRVPRFGTDVDLFSTVQTQEGAEPVNRQNLRAFFARYFENRWFAATLGQAEKSQNQGLDVRVLLGGGVGRRMVQTNRSSLRVIGGAAFSREKFEDLEDFQSNAELVGTLAAETFQFDSPELDLSVQSAFFLNLNTAGRYRIQVNGKARIEIVKNLYWSLTIYESYDSEPPSETFRRNDFGITTSVGWTFN